MNNTKKDYSKLLKADFPTEAYSKDTSRGFELTSIKAAYVIERLNEVFGLCGTGWKYKLSKTQNLEGEIVIRVKFQYKMDGEWSEPIYNFGGKKIIKTNYTDAYKSAVTDALTKIASMLGVGHKVFKGLVKVGENKAYGSARQVFKPKAKADELYKTVAQDAVEAGI